MVNVLILRNFISKKTENFNILLKEYLSEPEINGWESLCKIKTIILS
jgi:hypothetical protein